MTTPAVPTTTIAPGVEMPLLGLGTWQASGDAVHRAVLDALELGYRSLDTATMYGNEDEVGRAVRDSGLPREDVFVTTKLLASDAGDARGALEASLGRLGLDHVDLYLVHWPPSAGLLTSSWAELLRARDDGLARAVGVSNYDLDDLDRLVDATGVAPAVNQVRWGPALYDADLVAAHASRGVVLEGYSPFKVSDMSAPAIADAAAAHRKTPEQVVLRWHLQHGVVAIPKSTRRERIAANLDVLDVELTAQEMRALLGADGLVAAPLRRGPERRVARWGVGRWHDPGVSTSEALPPSPPPGSAAPRDPVQDSAEAGTPGDVRRPLRVAVVGSGPAGVFTAGALLAAAKGEQGGTPAVTVDVVERLPVPFGLVRYGVSPDHPEMKAVVDSLADVLDHPAVRLVANVEVGRDVTLEQLRAAYDAVVLATGSSTDAPIDLPGQDLPGCHGASELVGWYQGHPDAPRDWDLSARSVAVLGVGNVALDVARMIARPAISLLETEVPASVHEGMAASALTDVHVIGRRGPEHAKFSPLELREIGDVPGVEVVVDPADLVLPLESVERLAGDRRARQVLEVLSGYAERESTGAPRRIHLHFGQAPVEVLGSDRVEGLRTRRTSQGATDVHQDWDVQAVYRAVGYRSSPVPGAPFDEATGTVPHEAGRVLGDDGEPVRGLYVVGWLKRGAVGLVGTTRRDARETVASLLADVEGEPVRTPAGVDPLDVVAQLREGGLHVVDLAGWRSVDAAELSAGAAAGRPRIKLVSREDLLAAVLAGAASSE